MLRNMIQTTAIFLTLGASFFLLKANLGLTPDIIVTLSANTFGFNTEITKNFAKQSADTRVGFILLMISFLLQMWILMIPIKIGDFTINWHGVLISIFSCILFLFLAQWYSKKLSEKYLKKSIQIMEELKAKSKKQQTQNS